MSVHPRSVAASGVVRAHPAGGRAFNRRTSSLIDTGDGYRTSRCTSSASPLNSTSSAASTVQTTCRVVSQSLSMAWVKTRRLYVVTKTRWADNSETLWPLCW